MKYANGKTEEKAYVFAAVLPASSYIYAEPLRDMKNAFECFGGVPRLLVPDNTKTAVVKAGRYEAELNRTYKEMAGYYGCTIIPARPRSPTDKASAETAVQIVERLIMSKLRHAAFLSFKELAEAFDAELDALNEQPFQKRPGSRRSAFMETERHELMKLPAQRYEYARFKQAKAGFDYHVALDKNQYYSVPYQYF